MDSNWYQETKPVTEAANDQFKKISGDFGKCTYWLSCKGWDEMTDTTAVSGTQ